MSRLRRPVFAANWKMHYGPTDAREFMHTFLRHFPRHSDRSLIFFPPAATIPACAEALKQRNEILLGVQNIHWEDKGAFTGELSASIARDAGAHIALVGHSERRHVFGESDEARGAQSRRGIARTLPTPCGRRRNARRARARSTEEVVLRPLKPALRSWTSAQAW